LDLIKETIVNNRTLRLVKGDITMRDVDAIVNAANAHLQHGGGVAGAIVRKGGQVIQEESNRMGFVPVGQCAVTTAGSLPARAVIHAVGPRMGEGDEESKLKSAVQCVLKRASEKGFASISMPAISSGIFGFPKDRCANILVQTSAEYLKRDEQTGIRSVEFCIFDDETLSYFRNEFEKLETSSA